MSKIIKATMVKRSTPMYPALTKNKNNKKSAPQSTETHVFTCRLKSILALSNFKASHVFLNLMLHIYNMQSLFQLTTELTYWDTHDADYF